MKKNNTGFRQLNIDDFKELAEEYNIPHKDLLKYKKYIDTVNRKYYEEKNGLRITVDLANFSISPKVIKSKQMFYERLEELIERTSSDWTLRTNAEYRDRLDENLTNYFGETTRLKKIKNLFGNLNDIEILKFFDDNKELQGLLYESKVERNKQLRFIDEHEERLIARLDRFIKEK